MSNGKSTRIKQYNTPSLHAEIDAYLNLQNYYKKKELDLFVVRFSSHGELCSSRPCFHCLHSLANSGLNINYVYYSKDGEILKERFDEMFDDELTQISSGMRLLNRTRDKK